MKIRELLSEAKGLFGRSAGDLYTDELGNEYKFVKIETFPNQGKFESHDEFQEAVEQVTHHYNDLIWVDKNPRSFGAFAVVTLQSDSNEEKHYAKIFSNISGNMFSKWGNNGLPGLTFRGKGANKANAGFKPQQLYPVSNSSFNSGKDLVNTLINSPTLNDHIKEGIQTLSNGALPVFKDEKENFESIRDFLGETLQVIAITTNPQLISGQLEAARSTILGNIRWQDCSIEFPPQQNYGLVDSLITAPSGEQIGISSKGGSGADASVKNIYDALKNSPDELRSELTSKYPLTTNVITIIAKNRQDDGPIELGKTLGLITEENGLEIKAHLKNHHTDISKLSPWAQNFSKLYGTKESHGWNYGNLLLANLAKECAKKVNQDPSFSKGCLAFLNNAGIVQVYTKASVSNNDVKISSFESIYPPQFSGKILLNGSKNYYATRVSGKFAFGPSK